MITKKDQIKLERIQKMQRVALDSDDFKKLSKLNKKERSLLKKYTNVR